MQNYIDKIINNVVGYGLTYKQKFNKKYGFDKNESHSINEISKITKYKKKGLETIYNKGIGAYHTNPKSVRPQVHSPEQWAMARIYASINPSSKASKVDKSHLISGGKINFHKIHWGAFTKQFNNRKNKRLKNFKEFSNYILKHPDEFNKITKQRANFYKNFIFGRGIIGSGVILLHNGQSSAKTLFEYNKEKIEKKESITDPNIYFSDNPERLEIYNNKYAPQIDGLLSSTTLPTYEGIIANSTSESGEVDNNNEGSLPVIQDDKNPSDDINNIINDINTVLPVEEKDIYEQINDVNEEIEKLNFTNNELFFEKNKIDKSSSDYKQKVKYYNDLISKNITKITELEDKHDELLEKQIQNLQTNLKTEKDKYEDIIKNNQVLDLGFIEITDESLTELPEDIINDGTIHLKTISISDKIARENILKYYENNISESEMHKKLTDPGSIFEWTSVGENNDIFSRICSVGDNNVLMSNNIIEELFIDCKERILKNNPDLTEEDLKSLKSASSQFPQDLIDIINDIANERKDYDKDFLKLYNEQIKLMKEVYDIEGHNFPNITVFKKWYYKNYDYEGIEIQIAKFNKPDFNKIKDNWANSKSEIEEAYKNSSPLYLTKIDKQRYITGWEKTFKFDSKAKSKREEYIRNIFVKEMNEILNEVFDKKYKYIITSNCKECVANYNFTDDTKIKKHILEVYKLKETWGGSKAVNIPITEFRPVQSTIKEKTNIIIQLLEKQLKNKKSEKKKATFNNNQLYVQRINDYIPFLEKTIQEKENKLASSKTQKDKDKYTKAITTKREWLNDAIQDLEKVSKNKNIGDVNRKSRYKNFKKK